MNKLIDLRSVKVIFFDFDGVIADTEEYHFKAFNETLKKYDLRIAKEDYYKKYLAYDDKGCFRRVFLDKLGKNIKENDIKKLVRSKTKYLMGILKNNIKLFSNTIEFIKKVKKMFPLLKFAIVSGALKEEIVFILKKSKIDNYFSFIVSAEDVKNGKPSKEPFLKAKKIFEKMFKKRLSKKDILVIEDSINGIKSAQKLGFRTVALTHSFNRKELLSVKPTLILENLTEML